MKKVIALFMLIFGITLLAAGGHEKAPTQKFTGEIVDLACYLGHGAKGASHEACALTCLKAVQPMGLLTSDGKVYLLAADHDDYEPYNKAKTLAAKNVEVTGSLSNKDGISMITVTAIKTK